MKTASIVSFGCKANQYDSQAMGEALTDAGYRMVHPPERADLYIVNTCSVTGQSDAKARKAIRRIHRISPDSTIFVTGCYAQNAGDALLEIEGVDKVFGNAEKFALTELAREAERTQTLQREYVGDPDAPVDLGEFGLSVASFDKKTRALLKIQDGCSQFCSFCIIPYTRGRMRSRPLHEIVDEARRLTENGYAEIVVTGVHLGAYGKEIRPRRSVAEVLRALHELPRLKRLRLSSIEPMDVPSELIRTMAELPKCARHLHLPLQSGSTPVLKRMRRRYSADQFLSLVESAREAMPDVGLSTDVMVGFPGETDADFEATMRVVERCGFHRLHAFRYSPREGTPAAQFDDQIPPWTAGERSAALRELGAKLTRRFQEASLGSSAEALIEDVREGADGSLAGYTGNYLRVLTDAAPADIGKLRRVRLCAIEGGRMRAALL